MTELVAELSLEQKLVQSCKDNNVEEVRSILSNRIEELSQKTLKKGFIVSICSASYTDENVEIARLLLEHGIDVNYIFKSRRFSAYSSLQWSIIHLKPKIIELLTLHGADLNYTYNADRTNRDALFFMHYMAAFDNFDFEACRRLVYLMLFRNVQTSRFLNYFEKNPKVNICFPHWKSEMLVYCLEKKEIGYMILTF